MGGIFISYRREDVPDATGRIYDRLVAEFGKGNVFKDVDSIGLSEDFRQALDREVSRCSVFLAVIGPAWLAIAGPDGKRRLEDKRDFVRIEVESALRRGVPIVPVLVGGAAMPSAEALPHTLQDLAFRNGTVVRPDPDFHNDMDRLIRALRRLVGDEEAGHLHNSLGNELVRVPEKRLPSR